MQTHLQFAVGPSCSTTPEHRHSELSNQRAAVRLQAQDFCLSVQASCCPDPAQFWNPLRQSLALPTRIAPVEGFGQQDQNEIYAFICVKALFGI
jgi:hypothetical protein